MDIGDALFLIRSRQIFLNWTNVIIYNNVYFYTHLT